MIPRATYRIQFHKGFPFARAAELAPYLGTLGISHVYSSPILKARAGSLHGYDVVDHSVINPELGGESGFLAMASALKAHGIGIILDIVPNHMAVGKADNIWWLDILEKGRASAVAHYFDIDWDVPGLEGKILAPFLDGTPRQCLDAGTLRLTYDDRLEKFAFAYCEHRFPLRPTDQKRLAHADLSRVMPEQARKILSDQNYVLADWRDANTRINWRRFFDITELAALRMECEPAFEAVHAKIISLYTEGLIDGVRVDHIDGLSDPRAYCHKLRERLLGCRAGEVEPYLIVEKILASDEELPCDWKVDGTTGYDVMNDVAAVLHAEDGAVALSRIWLKASGCSATFEDEERIARREILDRNFAAQRDSLVRAMNRALVDKRSEKNDDVVGAISEIMAELRCYRTYCTGRNDSPPPGLHFARAIAAARANAPALGPAIDAVTSIMRSTSGDNATIDAIRRFHQLSASLAAKAVEDTAFYRYGRLLSRNDVGSDPRELGVAVGAFHRRAAKRAANFPNTMGTTATHDHKRGEDARARLAVLSEIPMIWQNNVQTWLGHARAPEEIDRGDIYQLFQTLLSAWPIGGLSVSDAEDFARRVEIWSQKFLREAKLRSSWTAPNEAYEAKLTNFVRQLVRSAEFRQAMEGFLADILPAAMFNSFVQVILRNTLPGVPDLFQGSEGWDFSMVDPDNRAPVNYDARQRMASTSRPLVADVASWKDGAQKQGIIKALLRARKANSEVFAEGSYDPLPIVGTRMANAIAFARKHHGQCVIVVAALQCADALYGGSCIAPPYDWWDDTTIETHFSAQLWRNVLTGASFTRLPVLASDLFSGFPASVLVAA